MAGSAIRDHGVCRRARGGSVAQWHRSWSGVLAADQMAPPVKVATREAPPAAMTLAAIRAGRAPQQALVALLTSRAPRSVQAAVKPPASRPAPGWRADQPEPVPARRQLPSPRNRRMTLEGTRMTLEGRKTTVGESDPPFPYDSQVAPNAYSDCKAYSECQYAQPSPPPVPPSFAGEVPARPPSVPPSSGGEVPVLDSSGGDVVAGVPGDFEPPVLQAPLVVALPPPLKPAVAAAPGPRHVANSAGMPPRVLGSEPGAGTPLARAWGTPLARDAGTPPWHGESSQRRGTASGQCQHPHGLADIPARLPQISAHRNGQRARPRRVAGPRGTDCLDVQRGRHRIPAGQCRAVPPDRAAPCGSCGKRFSRRARR